MEQNTICKERRCQTISDWFFDMSNWPSGGFVSFHSIYEIGRRQRKYRQVMPTKFVNILETSKLRIRGQYLDSVSYVLLHFLTLRLYENLAPVQDKHHVSWVWMAGPNCLRVTTLIMWLMPSHIPYITYMIPKMYLDDTHAVSDYVLWLHNTKFHMPLRLTIKCQLNKKHTYVSVINYCLSHCNNMQSITFFYHIWTWYISE